MASPRRRYINDAGRFRPQNFHSSELLGDNRNRRLWRPALALAKVATKTSSSVKRVRPSMACLYPEGDDAGATRQYPASTGWRRLYDADTSDGGEKAIF